MNKLHKTLNKQKIDAFWQRRSKKKHPRIATHFKLDSMLDYDVDLIKLHLPQGAKLLDLGCGTGAIINQLSFMCSYVQGIDKIKEFFQYCESNPHIFLSEADIVTYIDQTKYDVIIIFGVMNYIEEHEASNIYKNCYSMLKSGGKLIVKHACGIKNNVVVDSFSEEIGDWYHAIYRYYKTEKNLLSQYFTSIEMVDIYPLELNRWENTHFYAFIATKTA